MAQSNSFIPLSRVSAAIAAGHLGSTVRKIATGIRPAKYLIHNILNDKLFHLGDA